MRPPLSRALASLVVPPALGLTLAAAPAPAQHAPRRAEPAAAPLRPVASVEGITEYRLANGLRVLLFPDVSKPTVTVNITYLVGSRHEGYGETGMAHLLEHMVFKGSQRHRNIPQELTEHGSRPNGTTWYDRTNYFETVPASDANLDWALDLEADRMTRSFIAKKDLESEFSVVRNEFEAGENSPFNVLLQRVMSTAYLWHGYGRSTIGSREDIERVPIDRLQAFYRRYYQPDNAVLVVAGKFDPVRTLSRIQETFGVIPAPPRSVEKGTALWKTYTVEPPQDGEREVTLRRVGDVPLVLAGYHVPAGSHPDFAAVEVLSTVLGDAPSGRLYKALVESRAAADVGAFAFQLKEPGMLMAFARLRAGGSLDSARALLVRTLDAAVTAPVTPDEVDRAKAQFAKEFELLLANSEQVGFALTEWAAMGDWRLMFLHRDRVAKVTPADVQRAAATYLKPSNRTIGTFVPTPHPDRTTVADAGAVEQMVATYTGHAAVRTGEAFEATPAVIDARTIRTTLPDNLHLQVLPKRTRGETVVARVQLRYGTEQSLTGLGAVPQLLPLMLSRGTTALTRQQVQDSLDRLKSRISISGAANTTTLTLETTRANLAAALRLAVSELRSPRLDSSEFATLKQEQFAQIEQLRTEPQFLAWIGTQRRLNPVPRGHPLHVSTVEESLADLNAATVEQLRDFHARFVGATDADVAVVGDVDADSVKALVRSTLGNWKSPQPFARLVRTAARVDTTAVVIETPDKANAMLVAGTTLPLRDDDPDYPALVLADFMFGGGFLNSRLATRLRQQEGISYGVGSSLSVPALDRAGTFITFAIFNPQNAPRLLGALREEVTKATTAGFTAAEVAAAKPGLVQGRSQARANDDELVGILIARRFAGRTLAWDADLERKIAALTPEEVNAAMKKFIDPSALVIVRAGDFHGKQPPSATP